MPEYIVVAGPNGADKVKAEKEKLYPDLPDESIAMMITSAYWNIEDEAVDKSRDLTVETNLRDDFLINRLEFFKRRGYTTTLIYMLLPDIETSTERVALRVAQDGHYIDPESIEYNFRQGREMMKQHFNKFDSFSLIDGSGDKRSSLPDKLLTVDNHQISYINPNLPSWAKSLIDEMILKLNSN